jgi:hypothetical protein
MVSGELCSVARSTLALGVMTALAVGIGVMTLICMGIGFAFRNVPNALKNILQMEGMLGAGLMVCSGIKSLQVGPLVRDL